VLHDDDPELRALRAEWEEITELASAEVGA
jgi:hypothetical protein